MELLRTADRCFENLPGYPWAPNYLNVAGNMAGEGEGIRIHYLDEGPAQGPVVLLLHGEPSWSYLYRKMIPVLVDAGCRVLAPDLVGFGRSDKPARISDYSYQRHVDWMLEWLNKVDLTQITLFGQDWGSLIGLRLVAAQPERFSRVVLGNGGLPTGDENMPAVFKLWQAFATYSPVFPVGAIMRLASKSKLTPDVVRAYQAPYPEARYLAGARAFPALVPTSPDNPASQANRDAWEVLAQFDRPFHTAFSDGDPITRGADRSFRERIPGARDVEHTCIHGAGHFLQEDKGENLAAFIVRQIGL